jgi:hypothetical protein
LSTSTAHNSLEISNEVRDEEPVAQGDTSSPEGQRRPYRGGGFGFRSVLDRIDFTEPRPEHMDMFDWCAEVFFREVYKGQLATEGLPGPVREFFVQEPYKNLVDHAVQMFHPSVQNMVNSGEFPTMQRMRELGFRPSAGTRIVKAMGTAL